MPSLSQDPERHVKDEKTLNCDMMTVPSSRSELRRHHRRPRKSTWVVCISGISFLCLSLILRPSLYMDTSLSEFERARIGTEEESHTKNHRDPTNDNPRGDLQLCFVTCEFSKSIDDADQVPRQDQAMIRDPPRHYLFTNLEDFQLKEASGWKKIVLNDVQSKYKRLITQSRWGKFLAWKHPQLKHCGVIFYADAYMLNPVNESAWQHMGQLIVDSKVGLMQGRQIGNNRIPVKGPVVELKRNARIGKVSWETANYTIDWLRSRPDFQFRNTPVYKNALFGYDPHNPTYRQMSQAFWEEYSKEVGAWRDQPYWAYFLTKFQMKPLAFPFEPPLGKQGDRGHNGHVYVVQNETQT